VRAKELNPTATEEALQQDFKEADKDGSGSLNLDEYKAALEGAAKSQAAKQKILDDPE